MKASGRVAWIDATSGIAGDMLLGALLDAGASLDVAQAAVDAVAPSSVRLTRTEVVRCGMRAVKAGVEVLAEDQPHRTWRTIRGLLSSAELAAPVRAAALAVFERLARAEARVHGVPADEVHFHEVGAWDSIADVVGVCAALHDLGVTRLTAGAVAVGSGRVRTAHGEIPVPVPAVLELAAGREIFGGGSGELATPTGMALVTALTEVSAGLPRMCVEASGVGAGTKDTPRRPNVVRVVVGTDAREPGHHCADIAQAVVLEANVDDLDPRVWPGVLASLLAAGASDAWLVPILMKKGRPAHTLRVLAPTERAGAVRELVLRETSTIGVRESEVLKTALQRMWVPVPVLGGTVPVKVAHRGGLVMQATPEFDDVAALAAELALPVRTVLDAAVAGAVAAGLVSGATVPQGQTRQ
ncbi:nickel pincer cofactor biosynthesis protein LarC [Streptomyces sp. NPDC006283]|uniref:nickel pincer cofactor biosynthesis protein LarC n=1 Tax=Streptomyces sp. NPDC006283 TaxID=3156741 RepID=UPI0033BF6370